MMNLINQLKRHVAFTALVCKTSSNERLIGYGHDINKKPLPDYLQRNFDYQPMTEDEALNLLASDILDIYDPLIAYVDFTKWPIQRQRALLALLYMIGFWDFGRDRILVHALNFGDFKLAAECVETISKKGIYAEIAEQLENGGDE